MSNRRRPTATTRPNDRMVDPRLAVQLDQANGTRQSSQELARHLLQENATLMKVLGMVLERTGPVELDDAILNDSSVVYEIERYDSTDGASIRWVGKRGV